ncbi:MAG: hypothetical protein U0R19_11185 [Bryobacteraceae bacterium]
MRTTLDIEPDVLNAARALANARGVSVGVALSELARRGMAARMPLTTRVGFPVFQVPSGTPHFGSAEVEEGLETGDALEVIPAEL